MKTKLDNLIVPLIAFALLLACQHVGIASPSAKTIVTENCQVKPFTLEIAEKKPIFEEKELPKGILLFDSAKLYVEKLNPEGDVVQKLHVSEEYDSPNRENLNVQVHCLDNKKKIAANFESQMPTLKKIEIGEKGNRLESKNILVKLVDGKVEFNSKLPTPPTSATTLRDFFNKFGVNYAFYKISDNNYELRGHLIKDGVRSYVSVQYHLVVVQ